ncbi:MAG: YihY/virulence factor BrkB family protein [Candidatus Electrothrix sp. AR4]|nr:YihY/virulence factor BrkB family protein [Candidatus Electrothrix sp. AR4]
MRQSRKKSAVTAKQALRFRSLKAGRRLNRWSFIHRPNERRITTLMRSMLRILLIMVHEFSTSNISLRASALTFSIMLSMVPLLAMSTAILKGLGNGDQMRIAAYRFIDQLDPASGQEQHPSALGTLEHSGASVFLQADERTGLVTPSADEGEQTEQSPPPTLNRHLHHAVDTIFDYVENTNFAALGAFGIAGLLIVVIMVLSSVEDAMNAIWHTRRGRSLFRKIMDYLALLVLLPISVNIALAGDAVLESPQIMGYITTVIPSSWMVQMLLKLLPFIFITLSLMMMYLFFPNVKVKTAAAFCGALFGAVFWFIVQRIYVVLQVGVAKYNAIYGSFATVPLFLIWIQLGWIFILLGAALAYAIQNHNHYQLPGTDSTVRQDLQLAFDVLLTVYNNFAQAKTTLIEQLPESCHVINEIDLARTLGLLIQGDLLHEIDKDGFVSLIPSRPAEQVTAAQVIRLILGHEVATNSVGGQLADQIVQAAEQFVNPEEFPENYIEKGLTQYAEKA